MSVDYYLYSPGHKRSAMVGSCGLSGTRSFPGSPEVIEFVRWALDNFVDDVCLVNEEVVFAGMDDEPG